MKHKYEALPRHIAFIMDGNGRWATNQGLPRSAGHKAGYEHIPDVLKMCQELGVNIISCYAWSTENWGRPALPARTLKLVLRTSIK